MASAQRRVRPSPVCLYRKETYAKCSSCRMILLWSSGRIHVSHLFIVRCPNESADLSEAGSCYLLEFPFMPSPSQAPADGSNEDVPFSLSYVDIDPKSVTPGFEVPSTAMVNLSVESKHAVRIRHAFATAGAKSRPIRVDVNGRKGRRVVCVLYGEGLRYEVLDLDNEVPEDEDEGEVDAGTMSD